MQCGGVQAQLRLGEVAKDACLPHLPLWGFTPKDAAQPLSALGVAYADDAAEDAKEEARGEVRRGEARGEGRGSGEARAGGVRQQQQHWRQPPLPGPALRPSALLLPGPEGEGARGGAAAAVPGGGAWLLRVSLLGPERRETLLLLPDACHPASAGSAAGGGSSAAAPRSATGAAGPPPQPATVAGELPPHLLRPVPRGHAHCGSGGEWQCPPAPTSAGTGGSSGGGAAPGRRAVLARVAWSAPAARAVVSLTLDGRVGAGVAPTPGEGCGTAGGALLCVVLCAGDAAGDAHAALRHPSPLDLDGGARGCAELLSPHGGNGTSLEVPLARVGAPASP